jgi:hypothetical protein
MRLPAATKISVPGSFSRNEGRRQKKQIDEAIWGEMGFQEWAEGDITKGVGILW